MNKASWPTLLLLAAALAVRGAYLAFGPGDFNDVDGYGFLARQLVEHGTYARPGGPTAFRPPLYPLVLVAVGRLQSALGSNLLNPFGIALLHLALGLGTVYLTLVLGRRLGLGAFAYAAAALVAVDPLLVYHSGLVMTETLFTLLVVALLASLIGACSTRQKSEIANAGRLPTIPLALAGILFGLAALCRPTIWAFLPLALLALAASTYIREGEAPAEPAQQELRPPTPPSRPPWLTALLSAGCVVLVTTLTVAPWALRNWRALGHPVVTTTHGGETFWRANNRWFYDACIRGDAATWQDTAAWHRRLAEVTAGLGEVEADRASYREAWTTIRARPADFARAVLYRWRALWRPWPSPEIYGNTPAVAIGTFYSLQFLLAAVGLCRRNTWRWPTILLPLLLLSVTTVHALYWTDLRMRAPLTPALALLAATGCQSIARRTPRLLDSSTP